jgi:hypothetical protein
MPWKYANTVIKPYQSWKQTCANNDVVLHSGDWYRWSDEEKIAAGLVFEEPQPRQKSLDKTIYSGYDEDNNPVVREDLLTDIRDSIVKGLKETVGNLLKPTDWYYTRKIETGQDVPENVVNYRTAVRNHLISLEASWDAVTDDESFKSLYYAEDDYPNPEDYNL